jgi:hypothetical protein
MPVEGGSGAPGTPQPIHAAMVNNKMVELKRIFIYLKSESRADTMPLVQSMEGAGEGALWPY